LSPANAIAAIADKNKIKIIFLILPPHNFSLAQEARKIDPERPVF
jgi:hypothetical protein